MDRLSPDDSENEGTSDQVNAEVSLAEDEVTGFITGKRVKLKGNAEVRQ